MTQRTIIMFAVVLGFSLSTVAQANALSQPTFDVNPNPGYVNEPVTLTDTSNNPPSAVHEWDCDYSGNPAEFNAEQSGSTATCVYSQETSTFVAQRVTDGGQSSIYYGGITIYSQSDKPFDTQLASPSTINVPGTVSFRSNKSQFDVYCYVGGRQCPAFVTGRSGPTTSGIYTYFVRVENAVAGQSLQLETSADNDTGAYPDRKTFTFHVASNANAPLKVISRQMKVCEPSSRHSGKTEIGARMSYYLSGGTDRSKVLVVLQKKDSFEGSHGKRRWITLKKERFWPDSDPSTLLSRQLEGLIRVPTGLLRQDPLRVTTKIKTPNDLSQSAIKKKQRLRPRDCSA